ncbi:hypothetical protein PV797_20685 [Clostridiaceae bacterium M8S5]|nr:hypothetical protein PV797_20685 [Clostridiaceae bacterium M8S5]
MHNKGWIKLSCIYVGSVVGAGFASGKELMDFFSIHGYRGLIGAIISSVFFMIIGSVVLIKTYEARARSFAQLINPLLGKNLIGIFEIAVLSFLYIIYCVMLAGSGAITMQLLKCSPQMGIYLMSIAVFIVLINNVEGLAKANTLLIPILVVAIIAISIYIISSQGKMYYSNFYGAEDMKKSWLFSSILYVSYNSIPSMVVLGATLDIIPNKKIAIKAGIMSGIILFIMSLFIIIPLMMFNNDLQGVEIPMLLVAGRLGRFAEYTYSMVLLIAMFTTAIGNAFGFVKRFAQILDLNIYVVSFIFCISAIPLSQFGFSTLVELLYPVLGYVGVILIVTIVFRDLHSRLKNI